MRFLLTFIFIVQFFGASFCDTFFLNDGTKISGTVSGEMEGAILLETKYGNLTIKKEDIREIKKESVSKQPLPREKTENATYALQTVKTSSGTIKETFFKNGTLLATRTLDSKGKTLALTGTIENALYSEYYADGKIKAEIPFVDGLKQGLFKAYYPSGGVQTKAFYKNGKIDGKVEIFRENGKILFEQNFKNSIPNGYFREYDENGKIKSETFYANGALVSPPQIQTASFIKEPPKKGKKENAIAANSLITAKRLSLARGEKYLFYLNDKYIARITLDKKFNILSRAGKVPDGIINVYSKDGKLERELTIISDNLVYLKVFEAGKPETKYSYLKDLAIKK